MEAFSATSRLTARALLPFDQDLLHLFQEIGRLVLPDGYVGIPDDPERDAFEDVLAGKEMVRESGHHILEQRKMKFILDGESDKASHAPGEGDESAPSFVL